MVEADYPPLTKQPKMKLLYHLAEVLPKSYRHGDIALIGIERLPDGLVEKKTDIIIDQDQTSGGNAHTFKGGKIYPKKVDNFIIAYFEAKNTTLLHAKHGTGKGALKEAKIEDGYYEIRRQNEEKHSGMVPVVD